MRTAVIVPFLLLTVLTVLACGPEKQALQQQTPQKARSATTPEKPNIVFILVDDADTALLPYMPEMRKHLYNKGTTLTNAIYSLPICCPSRASMLTGMYPHNTGIYHTSPGPGGGTGWESFKPLERSTVATWLDRERYQTFYVGKYINGYRNTTKIPPGWDDWRAYLGGYNTEDSYRINENGKVRAYDRSAIHDTDLFADKAVDFIRQTHEDHPDRPFFAVVATNAPHSPAPAALRHAGLYAGERLLTPPSFDEEDVSDKPSYIRDLPEIKPKTKVELAQKHRARIRSMLAVDDLIGSVMQTLEQTGELEDTYVFFWNDNGYHLGTHRLPPGKHTPYDEDTRFPMVVRGPGVAEGKTVSRLAVNTDLAPTFADIAGTRTPSFVDGRSLLPLLDGDPPKKWRNAVLVESKPTRKDEHPYGLPGYKAVRTETRVYVEWDTGEKELYDLKADPYQLDNILAEERAWRNAPDLAVALGELLDCTGEDCKVAEDGSP